MSGRLTSSVIHNPPKTGAFPIPKGLRCAEGSCRYRLAEMGYFWLGNGPFCHRCAAARAQRIDYASDWNFVEDPYKLAGIPEEAHYRYMRPEDQVNNRYTMRRLLGTRPTKG